MQHLKHQDQRNNEEANSLALGECVFVKRADYF